MRGACLHFNFTFLMFYIRLVLSLCISLPPPTDTCTIKSKFDVSSGPTVPTPALIQFMCDGSTLSGVAMAIENPAYKISLYKNKCFSGK